MKNTPVRQAVVPALYAWCVSILPISFSGVSWYVQAATLLPLLAIVAALLLEQQRAEFARLVTWWGVCSASVLVFLLTPSRVVASVDRVRGLLSVVGWALFAYTCAAPALQHYAAPPLSFRLALRRVSMFLLPLLSLSLFAFGWEIRNSERASLTHAGACILGLAMVGRAEKEVRPWLPWILAPLALAVMWLLRAQRDAEAFAVAALVILVVTVFRKRALR